MVTISLCMIVKNEEQTLPRCLDTVHDLVDEIVIVDTGSTDGTVEAARRYTDRVFFFPWRDDFAAARNFSFQQAVMDYCLWLDADDVLEPADRDAFRAMKAALPPDTDLVMLPYHTAFDQDGRPLMVYYRERLVRRAAGFRWQGAVHEAISPAGRVRCGEAAVTHRKDRPGDPDRNLRIYEELLAQGRVLTPREQYYYARELWYHGRLSDAAAQLEAFLDSGQGWKDNCIEACRVLADCCGRLGRREAAFAALARALRYGPPRAEICCDLGQFFMDAGEWTAAVFWYEQALSRPRREGGGSFSVPDCHDYIPCLQLCVCWYRLGELERAKSYNDRAGAVHPQSKAYRANLSFFAGA
ncbi:MAG: glycosyltransferase family 2 protein [Oscillospiraceae bacterium]|nr:glycosyltransferase family 2 protein [Oscillospiraceae bacterium]